MGGISSRRRYKDTGHNGNPGWFAPAPVTTGTGDQSRIAPDPWAATTTPDTTTLDTPTPPANTTSGRFSLDSGNPTPQPTQEAPKGGFRAALRGAVSGFTSGFRKEPTVELRTTSPSWHSEASGTYPTTPPLDVHETPNLQPVTGGGLPTRIPTPATAPTEARTQRESPTPPDQLRHMNGKRGRAWRITAEGKAVLLGNDFCLTLDSGQYGAPERWRGKRHVNLIDKFGSQHRLGYDEVVFQVSNQRMAA